MLQRAANGVFALLCLLAFLFLAGCSDSSPAVFRPQGPNAERINFLWWILFGLGAFTYILVMGLFLLALFRRKSEATLQNKNNNQTGRRMIWSGGIVFPFLILLIIYGFNLDILSKLTIGDTADPLEIEVIGHQWWWEVRYPAQDIVTANEIFIPTGREVVLRLTSIDVIHSFWVPELHGKMDLIPGKSNLWPIEADRPGEYLGLCAEFCGVQHAKMLFYVIAVSPADFEEWLSHQQEPAAVPATSNAQEGQAIFIDFGCGQCHTIDGTEADGNLGPNLTHFAARRTIGAGTVVNNRGNLGGWIADPHSIKPGILMPAASLTGEELQSLLLYLETLE